MNTKKIGFTLDPLLRSGEAAKLLGISQSTLWKWIKKRRIPYIHYGREARFRKSELIAWQEKQRVDEQPQGGDDEN